LPHDEIQFLDLGSSLRQDERGFVYFPFQHLPESLPLEDLGASFHLISIAPGQVRGQHRHPQKTEWLYVFHGQGLLVWRDTDNLPHQRLLSDQRTLVIIPPGIPHALQNTGPAILYLLAWRGAPQSGGAEPDTVFDPLI